MKTKHHSRKPWKKGKATRKKRFKASKAIEITTNNMAPSLMRSYICHTAPNNVVTSQTP